MSGWTNDIPAHLTRPRDQGVIDAPRITIAELSSWETSGTDGVIPRPILAGGRVLRRDAEVTVPDGVVIQCAPVRPLGLAAVQIPAWEGETFAQRWERARLTGRDES